MHSILEKHLEKRSGDVSLAAVKFSEKFIFQHIKDINVPVVRITRRKAKGNDSAFTITYKM
ncbi:hypothetical protein FACS1894181_13620 [Bacteroidia bacterium]|nr:hypothetical protein FACS1894181_13620 [Bacteroidia bacterium]